MKRLDEKTVNPVMVILTSGIIGIFISILFMFLFSVLVISQTFSESSLAILTPLSCFAGSVVSGYLSSKSLGKALVTSLIQTVVNITLAYFAGVIIFMRIVPQNLNLFCFIAYMVGAVFGGLLSAVVRPRRHKIK